jgi:CoA:oxalate CoA-transferase
VPCAPIANVAEVVRNPQLEARRMILRADHPSFDGLVVPGSPLKTAGGAADASASASATPNTRAPALGEHTERVMREVAGYDAEKIAALRAAGII